MNYEGQQKKTIVSPGDIEEAIDDYFDGSGELVLDTKSSNDVMSGGKRVLSALTFGSLDDTRDQTRRRKCRKINHSSVAGGFSSMVPGVLVRAAVGMFGSSTEAGARKGGPIVSLVLDEERKCLYTLGANGIICTYDLLDTMTKDTNSPPRLASVMDSVATAKLYLESVSCGRMYPPVTTQSIQLGTITFPGGINSAQAGVGGMDGAREILKRHDREVRSGNHSGSTSKNPREMTNSAGMLHPVSIHVVAGIESKSLTLVAVTGGGLRYYLSSLSSSVITSAQASQGSFDYTARGNGSKLARTRPAKKMTFCHIRAPPPYTSSDGSNGGLKIEVAPSTTNMLRSGSASGFPPGIHSNPIPAGGDGRKGDVVKGYYAKDVFVLALDVEKSNNSTARGTESRDYYSQDSGDKKKSIGGNALVVALSDTAARIVDTNNTTANTAITAHNSNNDPTRTSGGISEIAILPMCGIRGASSAVLPGGTTFDISSQNSNQSSLMNLYVNSETPSDSDLQIGLVPAFTPPKIKSRRTNPTPGASSAIVAPNQGRGVISSALSTLSNFLRSGQGYGYQVTSASGSSGGVQPSATYRVSRRHGCDSLGFSSSSAEIVTRPGLRANASRPTTPKAARLPTWLITPSAAPMSFQSSMHLNPPGSDSVLVLNAGGLHFFVNSSILNNLASVLMRSSNVAKDESLRNFFTSYGYAEGCAMCFALITSSSSNSNLRNKAEQAALTHARNPSYKLIGTGDGRDPLSAYQFTPSSLYNGLVKFSSRLMRPCWHKAAVVVTEGKPIQSKHSLYSSYYSAVPAKVELLLDDVTLDEIRRPLILLQEMMKKTFVPVVSSVPGASKTRTDSMDVDDDLNSGEGGLYTTALLNQSRAAQRGNNQPHDLTADELRKSAYQKEDRNMHSLYRLWSRTIQMLNLMAILKYAHSSPALPVVQWGLIHGLTFHQLVTTFEGQQRIEALLNALFSQSENTLISDISIEDSQIADMLSKQCYLFFSSASRLTYLGFKSARDALSKSSLPELRKSLARKAAVRALFFLNCTWCYFSELASLSLLTLTVIPACCSQALARPSLSCWAVSSKHK
jgi:nuclear pore complex protein Nup155